MHFIISTKLKMRIQLVQGRRFSRRMSQRHPCLSIIAVSNCLRSIIVNHLRRQRTEVEDSSHNTIGVAVIYLKYNDPEQSLSNLLASLLKQFIEDQEVVPDALHILYERHSDHKTSLSTDEMINALKTTIKSYSKTFIVVDGLDECDEKVRWDLIERLKLFHGTAHIIITSRYLDSICEELEEFGQIEIKAHGSDIELYIDRQIRKNRNLRRIVQKNPQMRNDIKEGVVKTADKMCMPPFSIVNHGLCYLQLY